MAVAADLDDLESFLLMDEQQLEARIKEYQKKLELSAAAGVGGGGGPSTLSPVSGSELASPLEEFDIIHGEGEENEDEEDDDPDDEEEEVEGGGEGEEEGVKGVADVDYIPEDEEGVEMLKSMLKLSSTRTRSSYVMPTQ